MVRRVMLIKALCIIAWHAAADATGETAPKITVPKITVPKFPTMPKITAPKFPAMQKFAAVPRWGAVPKFGTAPRMVPKIPTMPKLPEALPMPKIATASRFTGPTAAARKLQGCEYDLGVGVGALVRMLLYYGMAHAMDTAALVNYNCETRDVAARCMAATDASCNNGCLWNVEDNTCEQLWARGAMWYIRPERESPMDLFAEVTMECNKYGEAACNAAGCEWKPESKQCEMSGAHFERLLCSAPYQPLLGAMQRCGRFADASSCDTQSDCAWKHSEGKCEMHERHFAMLAYGSTQGAELYDKVQTMTPGVCGEGEDLCTAMTVERGKCAAKPRDACTGECAYVSNEAKCDISFRQMVATCDRVAPSPGMTCGDMKRLYKANACCGGMPSKPFEGHRRLGQRQGEAPLDEEALLRRIDAAMRRAKAEGGQAAARRLAERIGSAVVH